MLKPSQDCSSPTVALKLPQASLNLLRQIVTVRCEHLLYSGRDICVLASIWEFEKQIQTSLGKTQNYQLTLPPSRWAGWCLTVVQRRGIPCCPDVHNWVVWVETWHNPSECHWCRGWQSWTPFTNALHSGRFLMLEAGTAAQILWL